MGVPRAMTRKQFEEYDVMCVRANPRYAGRRTDTDVLKATVDDLLLSLFKPTKDGFKVDFMKLSTAGVAGELINWGDLGCVAVELRGDTYDVQIEEADSARLGLWVEGWLERWGWKTIVTTEW